MHFLAFPMQNTHGGHLAFSWISNLENAQRLPSIFMDFGFKERMVAAKRFL
jgi:hypothetical protein